MVNRLHTFRVPHHAFVLLTGLLDASPGIHVTSLSALCEWSVLVC